ncbi:MAG: hypothetical protein ACHQF2_01570 [Flavobacteriales bacterium]
MDSTQQLFYALGELAYAIASADGKLQEAEKKTFEKIVTEHKAWHSGDFDYADVIFKILQKDKTDLETAYAWAMKEIELNKHHLTAQMVNSFKEILTRVAEAFPPVSIDEKEILNRFSKDIQKIGAHAS